MEYRTLGRTGLQISLLGMGTGGHNCLGQTTDPPRPREEKVGRASYGSDREVVVATPEGIEASVEASLRRLQVEALDLVLVSVLAPSYRDIVMNEHLLTVRNV